LETPVHVFWFRRDLRLEDNAGLYHALKAGLPVVPIFIFDRHILDQLDEKTDRRVAFIHAVLEELQESLVSVGSSLEVYYGHPEEVYRTLLEKYKVKAVFTNHDYEPYARKRDEAVRTWLQGKDVRFHTYKDQVIFDRDEVLKEDGKPYTVFTPYSKRWKSLVNDFYLASYPVDKYAGNFYRQEAMAIPSLASMGFLATGQAFPSKTLRQSLVSAYGQTRDYPSIAGTSRMGVHLRFGTVSIRELARKAIAWSEVYLNELIWREFYHMILWHFPQVGEGKSFKPAYEHIRWRNNEKEFVRWCNGTTGYPIVDAGMRELNQTGYMHNRVRMVTASFLSKHLLVDWRWGEAYFASKLLDFDLAANNGGWQWAAGCGCDAAPYFRIFNPTLQTQKFDKDLTYIRCWVPELDSLDYPIPMVVHEEARKRCLEVYGKALS
jgi:deoxyribodipyrimidine photo-lyase